MGCKERAELIGLTLDDKYHLGKKVGIGGTGVVFAAERLEDGEQMVVKVMRPMYAENVDLRRRLRREREVFERVDHPGLVPVYDHGSLPDGSPYIVLKRVYAESLSCLLLREGRLPSDEVAALSMRVSSILQSVHERGYVHRDVKPEHILMSPNSRGGLEVILLDFGVCAAETAPVDEKRRERGRVFGTPAYVSPEQASGDPDVDARADVFGLGVVMFEALAGRVPFTARDITSLLKRIIREDAPRVGLIRNDISVELDAVVARALSREKNQRFYSVRALSRALAEHTKDRWQSERSLLARIDRASASEPNLSPTLSRNAA